MTNQLSDRLKHPLIYKIKKATVKYNVATPKVYQYLVVGVISSPPKSIYGSIIFKSFLHNLYSTIVKKHPSKYKNKANADSNGIVAMSAKGLGKNIKYII